MILPDWFYAGVLDDALVLTIDRAYFALTGGLERWLYRLVRKHGGRQQGGWSFDLPHLHAKSGSLSPLKHFAYDLREIVRRQTLPGYQLVIKRDADGVERLNFAPDCIDPLAARLSQARSRTSARGQAVNQLVLSGTATLVPSGTGSSCYRGPESVLSVCNQARSSRRNFTNQKSFGFLLTDRGSFSAVHNRRGLTNTCGLREPAQSFAKPISPVQNANLERSS